MLRYTTDRAKPGLNALYDIQPGNGAGQFLQPRSPHGAHIFEFFTQHATSIMLQYTDFLHRHNIQRQTAEFPNSSEVK